VARNVVLAVLDTVRKDYFDEYAPRLAGRAGVRFEQCRAASTWSVPSHASMLAGQLPHQHGVHSYQRDFSRLSVEDTVLGDLADHRTLGASANVYASSAFEFDALFDEFSDVAPQSRFPDGLDVGKFAHDHVGEDSSRFLSFLKASLRHDHPVKSLANGTLVKVNDALKAAPLPKPFDDGANIVSREAERLVGATPEPFFLFVNLMDAHGPLQHTRGYDRSLHDVPNDWTSADHPDEQFAEEPHRSRYRGLYGAAIDYLDRKLLDLVDRIEAITDRETTVVVTADHGENLGDEADEGIVGHVEPALTEGTLHVPLAVVNPPAGLAAGESYLSHLDLRTLLAALARGEAVDPTRERIPAEVVGNGNPPGDRDMESERAIRAAYEGDAKYVWDTRSERRRYDLDPERSNWQPLAAEDIDVPAWALALFDGDLASFHREAAAAERGEAVAGDVEQRLEDLGYR
jgi:arylsulfatase A-like enzyme